MTDSAVEIHFIRPLEIQPAEAESCLTTAERARAIAFRFRDDAFRWTAFRAGLRRILADATGLAPAAVPLELGPAGKPFLAAPFGEIHFNLSHCPDLAVVALGRGGPVGIDLEPLRRAPELLECEMMFCHPAEIAVLPGEAVARADRLLRIWTYKEALLKAWGTGLSHPPDQVSLRFEAGGPVEISGDFPHQCRPPRLTEVRHPALDHYICALAAPPATGNPQVSRK